jgi:hypothetical protein
MLVDTFEAATADRACHLFTVLGPAGIGKSRLVREFTATIDGSAQVLSGRCLSYGEGIAFWPITEIAIQAAGILEDDPPDRARAALRAILEDVPDVDVVTTHMAGVLGLADAGPIEAPWAVRRFFEAMATRRPLVVVFDDVHWAEPALLDVIEHVADRSRDVPIVLLCMARPEFLDDRPGWGGGMRNAASVHLEPLSETEADALDREPPRPPGSRRRSASGSARRRRATRLRRGDAGDAARRGRPGRRSEWPTVDLTTVQVPPAISALLIRRLDRLSVPERCAEIRVIVGEVFERSTVRALVPEALRPASTSPWPRSALTSSVRVTRTGGTRVPVPAHPAADAAYDAVPKADRAEPQGLRELLWSPPGRARAEFDEFVGYHLSRRHDLRASSARTTSVPTRSAVRRERLEAKPASARFNRAEAQWPPAARTRGRAARARRLARLAIAWRLG